MPMGRVEGIYKGFVLHRFIPAFAIVSFWKVLGQYFEEAF
jgi:hypothetical protein